MILLPNPAALRGILVFFGLLILCGSVAGQTTRGGADAAVSLYESVTLPQLLKRVRLNPTPDTVLADGQVVVFQGTIRDSRRGWTQPVATGTPVTVVVTSADFRVETSNAVRNYLSQEGICPRAAREWLVSSGSRRNPWAADWGGVGLDGRIVQLHLRSH